MVAMKNYKRKNIDYAARLRAIRPYVNFDHDLRSPLSSAAKRQISAYYEYIQKLTVRPHQIYRSRSAKNLANVQRFAQHDPAFKHLTAAFVPNAGSERMKITINKKGQVHGKTGNIGVYEIPFDMDRLFAAMARDDNDAGETVAKYVREVIRKGPRVKAYVLRAGEFEVPGAYQGNLIIDEVLRKMNKYSADSYDADKTSSHYYGNWMHGLNGYTFHDQADVMAYRTQKSKLTKQAAAKYVAQSRREKRHQEQPPGFWVNDAIEAVKRARPPQPKGWREVNQREFYKRVFQHGYKEIKDRTA